MNTFLKKIVLLIRKLVNRKASGIESGLTGWWVLDEPVNTVLATDIRARREIPNISVDPIQVFKIYVSWSRSLSDKEIKFLEMYDFEICRIDGSQCSTHAWSNNTGLTYESLYEQL